MSNGNQQQNRGPLDVLEFPFASLFTPAPGADRERSSFNFSLLNNNPRVSVWTRVPGDKPAPIQGGIGPIAMQGILDEMEECYMGGARTKGAVTLESRPPRNEDGSSSGDFRKIVVATLKWGVSEEGIRWIMLESAEEERPKIVFEFKGFEWHHFRTAQGEMEPAEASKRHAVSTIRFMRSMYAKYCKGMTPEERKAQSERFQKDRGQRQGGQRSSGGYSNGGGAPKMKTDPMGSIVFNDEDVGF